MRLLLVLISTFILVALTAWWLTNTFQGLNGNPSPYESSQEQLNQVQEKANQYERMLNRSGH
jgi:hypothetical protein